MLSRLLMFDGYAALQSSTSAEAKESKKIGKRAKYESICEHKQILVYPKAASSSVLADSSREPKQKDLNKS